MITAEPASAKTGSSFHMECIMTPACSQAISPPLVNFCGNGSFLADPSFFENNNNSGQHRKKDHLKRRRNMCFKADAKAQIGRSCIYKYTSLLSLSTYIICPNHHPDPHHQNHRLHPARNKYVLLLHRRAFSVCPVYHYLAAAALSYKATPHSL